MEPTSELKAYLQTALDQLQQVGIGKHSEISNCEYRVRFVTTTPLVLAIEFRNIDVNYPQTTGYKGQILTIERTVRVLGGPKLLFKGNGMTIDRWHTWKGAGDLKEKQTEFHSWCKQVANALEKVPLAYVRDGRVVEMNDQELKTEQHVLIWQMFRLLCAFAGGKVVGGINTLGGV